MFDQTFVKGKTRTGWTVTAGFLGEIVALSVMIAVPLIWTDILPKAQSETLLLAPAPPPPPPPAPRHPVAPASVDHEVIGRRIGIDELRAPVTIPRRVAMIAETTPGPAIDLGGPQISAGLTGVSGVPGGLVPPGPPPQLATPTPRETQPAPAATQQGPLRVGGDIQGARLLKNPSPIYPPIARAARIQGIVVLRAIIAKGGTIRNLTLMNNASPLLVRAAKEAVSQWVYRPTVLDGVPVEVETEVTVNFTLQ